MSEHTTNQTADDDTTTASSGTWQQPAYDAAFVLIVGNASRDAAFRQLAESSSAWLSLND